MTVLSPSLPPSIFIITIILPFSIVFERFELLEKSKLLKAKEENIVGTAAACARLCKKRLLSIIKKELFHLIEKIEITNFVFANLNYFYFAH